MPKVLQRLLIALASTLAFLALLEGGLRLFGFRHPPRRAPVIIWNALEDAKLRRRDAPFGPDTRQLWAPRAGAEDPWDEGRTFNEAGYRGPLLPHEKRPGVLRVATLGDSSTFGMGVRYDECYTARLPGELAKLGIEAEALDGGVIGHTVRQGVERYRDLVRPFRPDVVTLAYGAVNDHFPAIDLPDEQKIAYNQERRAGLARWMRTQRRTWRVLHLLDWTSEELRGGREALTAVDPVLEREQHELRQTAGLVDWPGARRVSLEEFRGSLETLLAETRADGAELVLISMPRHPAVEGQSPVLPLYNKAVRDFARDHELPLYSFRGVVRRLLREGRAWDELFVDNYHPSPAGHAVFAEGLARTIAEHLRGGSTQAEPEPEEEPGERRGG